MSAFIKGGRTLPPTPLAGIDFNSGYMPVRRVFFYRGEPDIDTLQTSLVTALAHWPDFAGTIALHEGTLSLLRNDTGARFSVVYRDEPTPAFGIDHPLGLPCPWVDEAIGKRAGDGEPVFTVKLTIYNDHHWILGTCNSHALCDGSGYWQFMQCWRDAFHGNSLDPIDSDFPRFISRNEPCPVPATFQIPAEKLLPLQLANLASYRSAQWLLTTAELAPLKDRVNSTLAPDWVSTQDALMAALWQALARHALSAGADPGLAFPLANVINVRPRLGLTDYTGNMAFSVISHAGTGTLSKAALPTLAGQMREDSRRLDTQDITAFLQFLQQKLDAGEINADGYFTGVSSTMAGACVRGEGIMVNNWSKFPAYAMDFGSVPLWFDLATVIPMHFAMLMPSPDGIVFRLFLPESMLTSIKENITAALAQ